VGAGRPMCREERTLISDCIYKRLKKTVNFTVEQAMKAQRGSRHIALLLL
jgi:hypothetical protein